MTLNFRVSNYKRPFKSKPSRDLTIWNPKSKKYVSEIAMVSSKLGKYKEDVSISLLSKYIQNGYTWSPFTFKNCPIKGYPRRMQILFEQTQCIALDFDYLPESLSLRENFKEFIISESTNAGLIPNIVHTTYSHQEGVSPRYRAIYVFDSPFDDHSSAKQVILKLHQDVFNIADSSCTDLARLFFGSTENSVFLLNDSSFNSKEKWISLSRDVPVQSFSKEIQLKNADIWSCTEDFVPYFRSLGSNIQRYLRKCVECSAKKIEAFNGDDGQSRYQMVWKTSCYLARKKEIPGYIILDVIKKAIDSNPHFDNWEYEPEDVITSAIEWGKLYQK